MSIDNVNYDSVVREEYDRLLQEGGPRACQEAAAAAVDVRDLVSSVAGKVGVDTTRVLCHLDCDLSLKGVSKAVQIALRESSETQ